MIIHGSYLRITDNSGGKYGMSIKLLGYYKPNSVATIGDVLVVVIKGIKHKLKKVDNHKIYYSLLIRTRKEFLRNDNSTLKFDSNDIILLDKNKNPIGTRVIGISPLELRNKG